MDHVDVPLDSNHALLQVKEIDKDGVAQQWDFAGEGSESPFCIKEGIYGERWGDEEEEAAGDDSDAEEGFLGRVQAVGLEEGPRHEAAPGQGLHGRYHGTRHAKTPASPRRGNEERTVQYQLVHSPTSVLPEKESPGIQTRTVNYTIVQETLLQVPLRRQSAT